MPSVHRPRPIVASPFAKDEKIRIIPPTTQTNPLTATTAAAKKKEKMQSNTAAIEQSRTASSMMSSLDAHNFINCYLISIPFL